MKRKILFLLMLLCTFATGAWAQTYPFEFSSSKDAADAKWYSIQFRNANGNTYAYVANASSTQLGQSTNGSSLTFEQKAFCFVQSGDGFYIYNRGTGLGVKVDAVTDRAPVKVSETPTLIKYRLKGTEDHFLYDGVTNNQNNTLASWSNQDAFIAISAAGSRSDYSGARAVFTRVYEPVDYTINCTGLAAGKTGGVCYNRVNYTGTLREGGLDTSALIAMHVSGYNGTVTVNTEAKTINVAYSSAAEATNVLWDDNDNNVNLPAPRIPAIVKSGDYLLAFSDWRYNRNDIGRGDMNGHIDIEVRRSNDGGQTWSPAIIAADGDGVLNSNEAGFGDAAVVADAESNNVLMLAAAGHVTYTSASRSNLIRVGKFTSADNGATWTKSDATDAIYGLLPTSVTRIFATSGKILQGTFKKSGSQYRRIYVVLVTDGGDYVIYSDDFGGNWAILGGAPGQNTTGNEAHVTELPNGDILLDSRSTKGRMVNIYAYSNKETAAGAWGDLDKTMGMTAADCNGDIDVIKGYAIGATESTDILVQTAPRSGRNNVQYYYKVVPALNGEGHYNLTDFTSGWTAGYVVFNGSSAYSSIVNDGQGNECMLYEQNTTGNTFSYDIVFEKHSISQITNNAYLAEPAKATTIKAILSDGHGNTFEHEYEGVVGTEPALPAYCTLSNGVWENKGDYYTYTADVTMPFVVSNAEKATYYNIYFPIATGSAPVYLYYKSDNASKLCSDHSVTNKTVDDAQVMTAAEADTYKYSWAIEGDPFTGYKFRNRQSGTYINVEGANASDTQNATLGATGSVFTLDLATAGTYNGRWTMQSGTGYVVMWSWTQDVATYNTNINHQGGHFYLVEAPDFVALTADLADACNGLGTTVGTYTYTGDAADLATAKSIVAGETTATNAKQLKTLAAALVAGRGNLNMPLAGHFYRLKSHKYGTYLSSTTGRYNNNNNVFAMTSAQDATTICYLTADNHLLMYATGLGLCDAIQTQAANLAGNTVLTFQADARTTPAEGCYNIKAVYSNQTKWLYGYEGNIARNGDYTPEQCVWEIEEVDALPVTIDAKGYATLYAPVALSIPEGVTAYTLTAENEGYLHATAVEGTIPAETAVVLKGDELTYDFAITTAEAFAGSNVLKGTVPTIAKPANALVLDDKDGIGFYSYSGTNLAGFKAYYEIPVGGASSYRITFGELTGIISAAQQNGGQAFFDLQGRRVVSAKNGLFIQNGKKVIK